MRVRITASDRKGLPGLEWSKEIPPGGFLMGQDGGSEGSGPSAHINIDYSYWISKYKITNQQFCDFLNLAKAADLISSEGKLLNGVFWSSDKRTCRIERWDYFRNRSVVGLGDNLPIRWNVNRFEINNKANHAVTTSLSGAAAFASWYNFFLPTEVLWEKAARGEYDDAGEHRKYAWGNEAPGDGYASSDKPVGWYNGINNNRKVENYFGLYDLTGAREWFITEYDKKYESYPSKIGLDKFIRMVDGTPQTRTDGSLFYRQYLSLNTYKMVGGDMIYLRSNSNANEVRGTFRVLRVKMP